MTTYFFGTAERRFVRIASGFVFCCLLLIGACSPPHPNHPVVGAKNFTEQVILGELLAQEIEAKTGLKVERRFYLAGSYIAQQALVAGRIDAYVEYTGTALTAILKQPLAKDPGRSAGDGHALVSAALQRRRCSSAWL